MSETFFEVRNLALARRGGRGYQPDGLEEVFWALSTLSKWRKLIDQQSQEGI
jgi:hypothetical protein